MLSRNCIKFSRTSHNFLRKTLIIETYPKTLACKCIQNNDRPFSTTIRFTNNRETHFNPGQVTRQTVDQPTPFKSEELLEKLMSSLSTDLYRKNRVYKNDLVRIINKVKELNFSTKKQGLFLIRCCTELLPDETPAGRMLLVEEIWTTLRPHTKFDVDHYNELLNVYYANKRTLKANTFIQQMEPTKPNITTYECLLRILSEAGDINQATEVISNMKALGKPATADIFHSLIKCQGRAGNLNNIQEVLSMMKSLKLEKTIDTHIAVILALISNKKQDLIMPEMEKAGPSGFIFEESHIMEIVKRLAESHIFDLVPKVLQYLPEYTLKNPSISPLMQSVTTSLVFQNHPMTALEIYKCLPLPSFGPKDDSGLHGRSLVRDCVKASMQSSVIALIAQELMASGRNTIALHNACEAALQLGKVAIAQDLFTRMKLLGMPLRPHYFWPILIHNARSYGEKGIMNTLQTMVSMEVPVDYDTIAEYTLPHTSFTSPQTLVKKLLETGLSVSLVLTPVLATLLNSGQVRAASECAELFKGKIDADKILKPLLKGYLTSLDAKSTVFMLEDVTAKARQKEKDWVGRFLCEFLHHKKIEHDISDFVTLLQHLQSTSLKISTSANDYCVSRIPRHCSRATADNIRSSLVQITDERLVDDDEMFTHQIPHPKTMNEESLRAHLAELEAKSMNTRGVLRKLLQLYCRAGDLKQARDISDKCEKEGVYLSAGMKASIFDLHVKLGELELAEMSLADLNKTSPNFTLDEFKIIDFATLMVYRKRIDKAMELLKDQSKKRRISGGRHVEMNCWRLLDATAALASPAATQAMFAVLTESGYCKPNNTVLGPLIRVHLKGDDISEAVQEFSRLANKYAKTPLKHELLCRILTLMNDGQSEENFMENEKVNGRLSKYAKTVLDVDRKVHGAGDVQLTLTSALADVGYKKTLRQLLLDPTVKLHPEALLRRCERFADEKKLLALETIAECAKDLRQFNVGAVYELILSVYQRDDKYHEALKLWSKMQEMDIDPSPKFVEDLCSLLKSNNRDIPSELTVLLDKKMKSKKRN